MKTIKVLIVDDDPVFAQFTKLVLETSGCEAIVTLSATEALPLAASEKPDAIIMDISMPELDGFQVTEKLKADPATKAIPVILCSMTKNPREIDQAMKRGAFNFLPKPLKREDLLLALHKLVGLA